MGGKLFVPRTFMRNILSRFHLHADGRRIRKRKTLTSLGYARLALVLFKFASRKSFLPPFQRHAPTASLFLFQY